MSNLRKQLLPGEALPQVAEIIAEGKETAETTTVGQCAFLDHFKVSSEHEYKIEQTKSGRVMRHAQIGYRSLERSCRAYREIYETLEEHDCRPDRYGICLDWSMGYFQSERSSRPKGTGLILDSPESFAMLTAQAPVAPHFGDFVLGTPAAFENTRAALAAGSTSIGNLGQYFAFRLPGWDDDVTTTVETIKAIALCAAQPVPILIHSNLDDGFASLFTDLACALGAVLLERHIVNELLGGTVSHCYGHTYSEPLARWAFQRALAKATDTPGTMVYGNTTLYGAESASNFAGLGSYLLVDVLAQMTLPSGHAINPVPVSEALRIPDIDEVVEAHLFADQLIRRADGFKPLMDTTRVDEAAEAILEGGQRFCNNVLEGFATGGIDTGNPLELMLAIRRTGPRFLEEQYGPGIPDASQPRARRAVFLAATLLELEHQADSCVRSLAPEYVQTLHSCDVIICIATTDVHEYGKLLIQSVLTRLNVDFIDGGVCTDPRDLVARAVDGRANAIAISTYNGIALGYLEEVQSELIRADLSEIPVYIGGKLNQIVDTDNDMPVDVTERLREAGAIPCRNLEEMLVDVAATVATNI